MNLYEYQAGGNTILKFDFPNIYLPDSSHHGYCTGYVSFDINTVSAMPYGSQILNDAGIYFDGNPVVMTNNIKTRVGFCSVSANVEERSTITARVYPNPANDVITIETSQATAHHYDLTNTVGQTVLSGELQQQIGQVNIKSLPAGVYYITISNGETKHIEKLVKW